MNFSSGQYLICRGINILELIQLAFVYYYIFVLLLFIELIIYLCLLRRIMNVEYLIIN